MRYCFRYLCCSLTPRAPLAYIAYLLLGEIIAITEWFLVIYTEPINPLQWPFHVKVNLVLPAIVLLGLKILCHIDALITTDSTYPSVSPEQISVYGWRINTNPKIIKTTFLISVTYLIFSLTSSLTFTTIAVILIGMIMYGADKSVEMIIEKGMIQRGERREILATILLETNIFFLYLLVPIVLYALMKATGGATLYQLLVVNKLVENEVARENLGLFIGINLVFLALAVLIAMNSLSEGESSGKG